MKTENRVVRPVVLVGSLIALIFVAGIILGYYTWLEYQALQMMLGLVAIGSFFGILVIPGGWSEGRGFSTGRVQLALTSALVMLFVVYYATVIFWYGVPEAMEPPELPKQMLDTLSDLLKIVVPFYFGATAAEKVLKSRRDATSGDSDK